MAIRMWKARGLFTRPWTLRVAQRRMADDQFWEFACHEGNQDSDILLNR
jgi:hypothetical protein